MICLFISVLIEHPNRPNMFGPKAVYLLPSIPRNSYVTLPANSLKPVAIGLIEVTPAQYTASESIPGVWLFDAQNWRTKLVSDIPSAMRQRLNALLTDRDINAGVTLTDTVPQAINKIIQAIPANRPNLQSLVDDFKHRHGETI